MFGDWKPIGVEAVGYVARMVVWQFGTADQYIVWKTLGGHYEPDRDEYGEEIHTIMSGKAYALETLETTFQQDLNGDGTIGVTATVIEAAGATALDYVADADAFVFDGLTLKYAVSGRNRRQVRRLEADRSGAGGQRLPGGVAVRHRRPIHDLERRREGQLRSRSHD